MYTRTVEARVILRATTVLVPISYRGFLLRNLPRVSPFPYGSNRMVTVSLRTAILSTRIHVNDTHTPQQHSYTCKRHTYATTGQDPIGNRGDPLSTLLCVSHIPTSDNRPSASQLQRSATEHSHMPQHCYCL
jgi:hypothetical protein